MDVLDLLQYVAIPAVTGVVSWYAGRHARRSQAIERLQADKTQVLYIGDSTVDAETAQSAGVDFAGVTHGVTTAHELACYPHVCIMSSLEELL